MVVIALTGVAAAIFTFLMVGSRFLTNFHFSVCSGIIDVRTRTCTYGRTFQVYLFAYTGERLTFRVRVMAFAAMLRQVRVSISHN